MINIKHDVITTEVDDDFQWAARDSNNELWVYENEPNMIADELWVYEDKPNTIDDGLCAYENQLNIMDDEYSIALTWDDTEPERGNAERIHLSKHGELHADWAESLIQLKPNGTYEI